MTRKHLAEHIDSPMFKDLIQHTLIRFSIQNDKYVNGFILDVEESASSAKKPYTISYQKFIRTDPSTKKPVMKNIQLKSTKLLIISLCMYIGGAQLCKIVEPKKAMEPQPTLHCRASLRLI